MSDINVANIMLFILLLSEGVGVAVEIADIAKRIDAGEEITAEEIAQARTTINAAVNDWNNANEDRNDG